MDINVDKLLLLCLATTIVGSSYGQSDEKMTYKEYIKEGIPSRKEIEVFLNDLSWARFDPELGYTLGNYLPHDGMEGSSTISTSVESGARKSQLYADRPSRINTYGNSFTQCHQVSDGETWQEYLAAHLGEPIRNFGMGGYGVYQAYRRMLREESTENNAENVVLYIWGDDHIRSLLRCRYMLFREWRDRQAKTEGEGIMFHGNFWANIEMDLETGTFVENDSRIGSDAELYQMTDPEWLYKNLETDWALQMYLYKQGKIDEIDLVSIKKLSGHLDLKLSWEPEDIRASVGTLLDHYAFEATKNILDKTKVFAETNHKNLLIVLFDPYQVLRALLQEKPRYDQPIVDFLDENGFRYFDANLEHFKDYQDFNLSVDDYFKRYFIGHYSPIGNHFFAYKLKPYLLEMLEPKPITYQKGDVGSTNFEGYLEK